MRQLVFRQFSSTGAQTRSLEIIKSVIDIEECERLFQSYQVQVYGAEVDTLLICPSVRLRRISNSNITIDNLVLNLDSLLSLLEGLQQIKLILMSSYENELWWKRLFGRFFDHDPDNYMRALARVERVFQSILLEANILAQSLGRRLQAWYEGSAMTCSSLQNQNVESVFFAICNRMQTIQTINRSYSKCTSSGLLSQSTQAEAQTRQHLKVLGVNDAKLIALNQQANSFWRSQRYRAKLFYIRLNHRRLLKHHEADGEQRWKLTTSVMRENKQAERQLYWLFHRKIKSLYKHHQTELLEELCQLARLGLQRFLCLPDMLDSFNKQESLVLAWLHHIPDETQRLWAIVYEGLLDIRHLKPSIWKKALFDLHAALGITAMSGEALIQQIVRRYFVKTVTSHSHAAYPLLVQYTDIRYEPAVRVVKTINDVVYNDEGACILERITESVFASVERLYQLAKSSSPMKLAALIDLNLTSRELDALFEHVQQQEHQGSLVTQLDFIKSQSASSQFCQRQASCLIEMLDKDQSEKGPLIQNYLRLMSTNALSQQSVFECLSPGNVIDTEARSKLSGEINVS